MKKIKIGLYVIAFILIITLILLTFSVFEIQIIRDLFISPVLVIIISLILILKKQEK